MKCRECGETIRADRLCPVCLVPPALSLRKALAELDAAILRELAAGPLYNMIICDRLLEQSTALARPDHRGRRHGWRVIDRRLQALRKVGKIKANRKTGWGLA